MCDRGQETQETQKSEAKAASMEAESNFVNSLVMGLQYSEKNPIQFEGC
jgi:hypothetical protein